MNCKFARSKGGIFMTLRHMKIFVSVYQNNGITRASEELHLAQPSVSLAIRELEDYYGIRLFDRISRRLYVTEQGRMFYDYALHIVSLFDEMELGIRNWEHMGTLRIGSSITIGNFLLPGLVKKFTTTHPEMNVNVSVHNSSYIEDCILNNRIDFALIEGIPESPQIVRDPFMNDRLCLICGKAHPLASRDAVPLAELEQHNFILREPGSGGREILESLLTGFQIHLNAVWESVSTQAIVKAVAEGLGISILPYLLVADDIRNGVILEKKVEGISLSRKFSIIYHKHKYLTPSAREFIRMCHTDEIIQEFDL